MISNSGHDERGKYTGGAAGDQTGTEWQIRTWYNRPWNCVLRHPDANVRAKIAELAREAAGNNNIGYNQAKRTTFWYALKDAGYRPANIKKKCDSDCSAGVAAICKAVGYLLGVEKLKQISIDNYTGSMRNNFKAAGFQVITQISYLTSDKNLVPGDILLNTSHHTCINLDYGANVKPAAKPSTPASKPSSSGSKSTKSYSGSFPTIPPTLKKGSKGTNVKYLQQYLNWFGGYGLVVDGAFGAKTDSAVRDFQKRTGLSVDGKFGPASLNMAKAMKK